MLKLLGYPDTYTAAPGETVAFQISAEDNQPYEASLVRVICGDCNPEGPGLQFENIPSAVDGIYQGKRQTTDAGSYMEASVKGLDQSQSISFAAMIWPTLISRDDQTLISLEAGGTGLRLFAGRGGVLTLEAFNSGKVQQISLSATPLLERQWYSVHFTYDAKSGAASLSQRPIKPFAQIRDCGQTSGILVALKQLAATVMIAGKPQSNGMIAGHFDGKIDGPMLLDGLHPHEVHSELLAGMGQRLNGQVLGFWDFSKDIKGIRAVDISGSDNHGILCNAPVRAMKGWNWDGTHHSWSDFPQHYGAVHFHHDDLYDAKWDTAFSLTIPATLKSGAYAVRVKCGENTREATRDFYMPFFVRPPRRPKGQAGKRDKIAFLAPTASYIAYANHGEHITAREAERTIGRLLEFGHADMYMYEHPEIGGSLYDSHLDKSGVCYSSRLRPVLNFTSQYHSWLGGHGSALWQYNADTHLLAWLENKGFDFDVITDEALHEEGVHLLEDYRVILTGTHPEYFSTAMWDGLKSWIDSGGRMMYLGANGFYWHIAFNEDMPGLIEVRRAEDGIRTWAAEPGEYYHSSTGEVSGLFRRRGHAPNEICGLGFIAQGFDVSSYYRRAPDAENPRAAFIFEGVNDEIIGDFGLIGGGAAGLELDCITVALGSPPNILRLASSEDHSQQVMLVNEEFGVVPPNLGGDQNERVRADLAFYETAAGGAVFSVGSISWCGSLPVNGFDNNVSRITENVLRRFASETRFDT